MNKNRPYYILIAVILVTLAYSRFPGGEQNPPYRPPAVLPADNNSPLPPLPSQLGGASLASFYSGPGAVRDIIRLHRADFPLADGLIARYEGDSSEIYVWVSVSHAAEEAAELMRLMVEKMPASTVFTEKETFMAGDTEVYHVTGIGMDHYYWLEGLYVYWLAVTPPGESSRDILISFVTR